MSEWLKWRIEKDKESGTWVVFEQGFRVLKDGTNLTLYFEFPSGAEAIAAFAAGGR